MPKKEKKEEKEKAPKKTAKDTGGLIEVGVPGETPVVGGGVKEVFYRGEARGVEKCDTRQRELELQDKDSATVLDSNGNILTIYLH